MTWLPCGAELTQRCRHMMKFVADLNVVWYQVSSTSTDIINKDHGATL